jgi:hypothetical protein
MAGKWFKVMVEGNAPLDEKVKQVRAAIAPNGNDAEPAQTKDGKDIVAVFVRDSQHPVYELETSLNGKVYCEFTDLFKSELTQEQWEKLKKG